MSRRIWRQDTWKSKWDIVINNAIATFAIAAASPRHHFSASIDLTSLHIRGGQISFPCLQTLSLVSDNQSHSYSTRLLIVNEGGMPKV
jgi:hypothetical protein